MKRIDQAESLLNDPRPISVFVGVLVIAGMIGACGGHVWGYIMIGVAFLITVAVGASMGK